MNIFNKLNRVLLNESPDAGSADGAGSTSSSNESPNQNWQSDTRLDENGNPIEGQAQQQAQQQQQAQPESDAEQTPSTDQGEGEQTQEEKHVDLSAPVVKQVQTLIEDAGLNAADVAKAVTANDGKATPDIIKAVAEKHGDAVASIVASQLESFHAANVAKSTARDQAIYDQVGEAFKGVTEQSGKESWAELADWAKSNIPNDERKEINKVLAQGGLSAKYAVDDLINRFKQSDSFTQAAQLETGENAYNDKGLSPLSKSDYNRELRELLNKGHTYGESVEIAALDRRRTLGIQRGI